MSPELVLEQDRSDFVAGIIVNLVVTLLLQKEHRGVVIDIGHCRLKLVFFVVPFGCSTPRFMPFTF